MIKKILISLILLSFFMISGCSQEQKLSAVDINDSTEILYEVKSGTNITAVANELEEYGYIKDAKALKKYAADNDKTNIKAGDYIINKSMTASDILQKFIDGDNYKGLKLIVPEGYEAIQIARKIEETGIGSADDFMRVVNDPGIFIDKYEFLNDEDIKTLEGYLFPKTYFFKEGTASEEIADKMLSQFDIVYKNAIVPNLDSTKFSVNEIVTLASIVEREAAIEDEMPLVASVFIKRLDIGMALQSCATVQYILGERKPILSSEDISIDSPYNKYIYKGLPETAIASPGEKAIMAVIEPADTEYLYFLAKNDGSGEQVYSETYEEHLLNKAKYLGN